MAITHQTRPRLTNRHRDRWVVLVGFLALCYSVSMFGSIATERGTNGWYQSLTLPTWTPPGWFIGVVWTVLYGLMAVAAWRVWGHKEALNQDKVRALSMFGFQLALNAAWSWVFFYFREVGWAFVVILFLLGSVQATGLLFSKVSKTAAWLWLPYILWVGFATILNYSVWALNG
jgi:benzodiazapine receptor